MTNYERLMKAMTPENMATDMMCPYDGSDEGMPCLDDPLLRGNCVKCCYGWLMKEAEEDDAEE